MRAPRIQGATMPTVTYTQPNGTQQTLQVEEGTTLMRAAVINGIDGIIGE